MTREITNDDLWSAVRGLGMYRMDSAELFMLIDEHKSKDMFASKVITEAARQVGHAKRFINRKNAGNH